MSIEIKGVSLQVKIFFGLILIAIISGVGSTFISYLVLKNAVKEQNEIALKEKSLVLMSSFDYAISHFNPDKTNYIKSIQNKLIEIGYINGTDIVLYDLRGNFIVSNKEPNMVIQKKIPVGVLSKILKSQNSGYDFKFHNKEKNETVTSSYRIIRDNNLDPFAIAFFPSYYNNDRFVDIFKEYIQFFIFINILSIFFSVLVSWKISKNITKTISNIAVKISNAGHDLKPIQYSVNDEISILVRSYNRMIYQLREQDALKAQVEREKAWREMAKQVAHEVKNPLTPMKLTMQNFERKFSLEDPDLTNKVHKLSKTMVDQIDLIAQVASAFSEFAKLPEKEDSILNLNESIKDIVHIFNNKDIFVHTSKDNIMIKFDKGYLTRILTNLITNAQQASVHGKKPLINVDIEEFNKMVVITVQDNGTGIKKESVNKIFEPNFTTKSSGMGLGLTMVKKMIEEYKGSIKVKSEESIGTTFIITLPLGIYQNNEILSV